MNKKTLKKLRYKIDRVDDQIFDLILKRLDYVEKICKIKRTMKIPVYDKSREQIIIDRLTEKLSFKINSENIKNIINPIISISKDLQRRKK